MTTSVKKSLKTILPIALGVFLVWYWYNSTSEADREQIIYHIKEADLFWVGISILMGIIAYVSRAIRWNYLLKPLGYQPKLSNNLLIILISYFANLGIPRSGEILRATALTTYEDVPFEKGFGTIVTERVIDMIMLLSIITTTLILQTEIIVEFLENKGFNYTKILLLLSAAIIAALIFFLFIKKSKNGLALKIKKFVKGLLDGVLSIFKMKDKWAFVFHTLLIWTCYVGMFVVVKNTLAETTHLTISQLLVAFVAGAFAITTTNGGVGLYPIAVSKALAIFGITSVSGDAFGWIMWISQTVVVVVFGAISFLLLPLLNRNR
ncbi:flippase-like domain-containing protein [Maribacter sp. ANRC-HE7]|uniref:Flippase-like domain-containing protein n=1 Tax=Maribacter aquimaris TaxID=2737171 RepID=A0ABR7V6C3_9FLAO|nr:lysylphosphatidylglycerol synthase transmembrane domain-containing protein [Maribacter aquimaris]MBD0779509.1 flippase-like domain-containing protein [Maribacter aquimaris]